MLLESGVVTTTFAVVPVGTTLFVINNQAPIFVPNPLVFEVSNVQPTPPTVTVGSEPPPATQLKIRGLTQTTTRLVIDAVPIAIEEKV